MLKILLATAMLIPSALLIKANHLFTIFTSYSMIITLMMFKWLEHPLNLFTHNNSMLLALDNISTPLIIMSAWLLPLMVIASQHHLVNEPTNRKRAFLTTCAALQTTLIMTFATTDLIMFYIMFETTLVPTLILITRWGAQAERLSAGMYFLFYTLSGSLPLLIAILTLETKYNHSSTLMLMLAQKELLTTNSAMLMWLACMMAFMIKMPLYGLHLWLPKAHVEAPIAGSMILAAVLLKLGGYGIIRISLLLSNHLTQTMYLPFIVLSLWGMIMTSLICLRQTDLKSIIAYSSISHMGLVITATMIATPWSIAGAMILMIAHGLTSSALFCLANTNYERIHTRTLILTRGLTFVLPLMTTWWLAFSLMNLALPPTINLLGELLIIISTFNWNMTTIFLTGTATLITTTYSLYIFITTQRTNTKPNKTLTPAQTREHLLMTLHLIPLMLLIAYPTLTF